EQAGSFLEQPLFQSEATVDQPAPGERLGTQIGPYKLLQQIGEGGMGTVFMAEQTEPVKRWVALKIIKPGMDSQQVIARFEAERQALALMDHPNIAKVLDAGTVGQAFQPDVDLQSQARKPNLRGRSYFVMELVKGVPITQYCDEHHLTPRDRLDLFVHVCQAVQHAHTKGIIHRDLKPSNVLVAEYDDRPVPKVIDFGVAKATGAKLSAQTLSTQFGQLVGTLEYMSPEQAKLNALDIDTRSDIYALGVLLYELLTGSTPFEKRRLHAVAFDEVLRLIREEEPAKPSTRLSTTEGLRSIAANRGLEPKKLSGVVRGELDWIAMRCLEKDRNRRYETANALAMDVERYLNDEPVRAGPPSAGYRLRKFAKRNRGPVLAAAAVLVALVAGVIGTSLGLVRAVQSKLEAVAARQEETRLRRQAEQGQRREAELREQADQGRKREAGLRVEAEESQRRETMLRKRAETAFELSRRNLYAASIFAAQRAAVAGGVRRANELLDELRPKWGEQDLREWEWYYLDSLTNTNPRGGTAPQLEGHAGQVRTLAWSPDGSRLASAGYDGLIKVWELQTGTAVSLAGHTAPAYTVDWKSDGSRLVSCGQDGTIRTWDAVQGELLRTVIAHSGREVNFVAFSPDDSRIASAGDDGTVKLWDAETCRPVGTLTGHRAHEVTSVAWSRDGSRLASCGYDGLVKVWDAATLSESYEFVRSGEYLWAVAFSPDSRRLAAAGGFAEYAPMSSVGTITVWDLESR
ncbi:MAG TPA: protein kinase, partial [Pirellulales bacterium]|nr:protein kinase [Pirellulales bacterium]